MIFFVYGIKYKKILSFLYRVSVIVYCAETLYKKQLKNWKKKAFVNIILLTMGQAGFLITMTAIWQVGWYAMSVDRKTDAIIVVH